MTTKACPVKPIKEVKAKLLHKEIPKVPDATKVDSKVLNNLSILENNSIETKIIEEIDKNDAQKPSTSGKGKIKNKILKKRVFKDALKQNDTQTIKVKRNTKNVDKKYPTIKDKKVKIVHKLQPQKSIGTREPTEKKVKWANLEAPTTLSKPIKAKIGSDILTQQAEKSDIPMPIIKSDIKPDGFNIKMTPYLVQKLLNPGVFHTRSPALRAQIDNFLAEVKNKYSEDIPEQRELLEPNIFSEYHLSRASGSNAYEKYLAQKFSYERENAQWNEKAIVEEDKAKDEKKKKLKKKKPTFKLKIWNYNNSPIIIPKYEIKTKVNKKKNLKKKVSNTNDASTINRMDLDLSNEPVPVPMTKCMELISLNGKLCTGLEKYFSIKNKDYLVIGVVGDPSVGKSSLLNILASKSKTFDGIKNIILKGHGIFPVRSKYRNFQHHLQPYNFFITQDRKIFIDCPALSKGFPYLSSYSNGSDLRDLSTVLNLMSCCHLIMVVQDSFKRKELFHIMNVAEILKTPHQMPRYTSYHYPNLLFVENISKKDYVADSQKDALNELLLPHLHHTQCRFFRCQDCEAHEWVKKITPEEPEINSFIFPDIQMFDDKKANIEFLYTIDNFRRTAFITPRISMCFNDSKLTEFEWLQLFSNVVEKTHDFLYNIYDNVRSGRLKMPIYNSSNTHFESIMGFDDNIKQNKRLNDLISKKMEI